jgi:hypothetical protein
VQTRALCRAWRRLGFRLCLGAHPAETCANPNDELGKALGVKLGTLMAYLAPEGAAKHRTMPADLRLIVERVIEQQSAKSRK